MLVARWTCAATFARAHGTGFVHHHGSPHQIFAMARIHRALGGRVIIDLDEAKAPRLAGKAVAHHRHRVHSDARICEESLDIRLVRTVRQISYEKLLHRSTPNCNWLLILQVREIVCQKAVAESKRKTGIEAGSKNHALCLPLAC
jgi:hypothetical protein